jgi:hypothetical protein
MTDRQFLRVRAASAVIATRIGEEASAAEVEAIYRWMRSAPDYPPAEGGHAR